MHNVTPPSPPIGWEPCSPELLLSGVDCKSAQRWSEGPTGQHWHPPVSKLALTVYQVGDTDIVAAYTPEGAIEVLCKQLGMPLEDYTSADVLPVDDALLDATEAFDQEADISVKLATTLRQDVALLTEPSYLCGWE